jgi:hypothetical protein
MRAFFVATLMAAIIGMLGATAAIAHDGWFVRVCSTKTEANRVHLAFSGGGQGFSWSWIKGRTRDETDLPRRFRAVPKLYIRGITSQCPATYSLTPMSVSGSVTISFTAWNSMITRFAKEIGTILMIAPARRAPTPTLMINNTC